MPGFLLVRVLSENTAVISSLKSAKTLIAGELEELYNLKEDPEELINLARNPAYRRKVLELREKTIAELKRTDAGMVDDLPKPATLP